MQIIIKTIKSVDPSWDISQLFVEILDLTTICMSCYYWYDTTMPPFAPHSSFPAEGHACPPHSLYTIYPMDSDVTAVDRPEPLMPPHPLHTDVTAIDCQEVQVNNYILSITCANDFGLVNRFACRYSHAKKGRWPRSRILQEGTVTPSILTLNPFSRLSTLSSRISSLVFKIYLLLLSRNKRLVTSRQHITRR